MKKITDKSINGFLSYMTIERGCSPNTIKGYSHDLIYLRNYIIQEYNNFDENNFDWNQLKIGQIREFLAHLYNSRSNKTSSIHRRVCSIKAYYKYLDENDMITNDNPAKMLKYPKRPSSIPKYLDVEHIEKLFENTTNLAHRAILEVLYSTGARCNELRNMNLEDLNFQEGSIVIRSGKGNKDRMVLLSDRAAKILKEYINTRRVEIITRTMTKREITDDTKKAIFLSNRGKRIANRTIQHFISETSKATGIKHTTPHMLRHSFASHLVMNNTNIRVVQKLLGHANLDTTQIYANVSDSFIKDEFKDSLPLK